MIAILTTGVEEWILEGIIASVGVCNPLETTVPMMDDNIQPGVLLSSDDGSYFSNHRSIVAPLMFSCRNPVSGNDDVKLQGWCILEGRFKVLDEVICCMEHLLQRYYNGEPYARNEVLATLSLHLMISDEVDLEEFLILSYWQEAADLVVHLALHLECGHVPTLIYVTVSTEGCN